MSPLRARRTLLGGLAAGLALPVMRPARAAPFPERAVRIVVPYAVGVGPDVVARSLAERLTRQWGQPVIVDNKPGGSGIVAFAEVRQTAADGHTLFLADTATLAVNPLLHDTLPYEVQRDLAPLTLLFRATFALLVGAHSRWRSVGEMLDAARTRREAVSYASLGHGHASQVAIETFARAAGVHLMHVPFKDAGTAFTAVAAGDVDVTAFGLNTVAGLIAGGRLRALAVAARHRLVTHPELPTLPEAGGPAVEMHPWAALVARAGAPPPVLDQLQRDIVAALGATDVVSRAEQAGFELTPSTPQALRERIAADRAAVAPLVAEGRIARL